MNLSLVKVNSTNYNVTVSGTEGDYTLAANVNIVGGSFQNVESGEVKNGSASVANFNHYGNLNVTYIGIEETEQQAVNTAINAFVTAARALDNSIIK